MKLIIYLVLMVLTSCVSTKKHIFAPLVNIQQKRIHQMLVYRHDGNQYVKYRPKYENHRIGEIEKFKVKDRQ